MPFVKGQKHTPESLAKMKVKRDDWLLQHRGERRQPMCPTCKSAEKEKGSSYCASCDVERRRRQWLMRRYGMTPADFEELARDVAKRCPICLRADDLVVDHSHATGEVRGLLCRTCNSALGGFHDDPALVRRAFAYLTLHRPAVNSALVDQAGLANLLVEKGIITDEEYQRAIADAMEQEAERYTARLRRITGIAGLHLGEAGLGERPNDAPGRTPGGEG